MNKEHQTVRSKNENPFKGMGFIKFWIVSTLFCMTFPVSALFCYFIMGRVKTKQLVKALVQDFLQTALIVIVVVALIIWAIYHYLSGLF